MPELKPAARLPLRATLIFLLAAAVVAGVLPLPGDAAPETVVRSVRVPMRELLPAAGGREISLEGGELRSAAIAETGRAVVCSPMRSTGLGVTWRQPAPGEVHASVATRTADGSWSRPVRLDSDDDADPGTPDASAATRGSSFLWTGGSRCVRLALELDSGVRLSDLAVVFVDSSGDVPAASGPLPAASAVASRPRIVTREEWGADPNLMNCTPSVADEVRMGFVHHTAGSNDYTQEEADDVVRGVYAYHTNGRGWCDIGYNLLVDRFGTVYEGRSGGVDQPVIGAAQMGFNTRAFSVSVMGNFETAQVPSAVQRSLVRILTWRLDVAHVNPLSRATMTSAGGDNTRFEAGTVVRLNAISGHRDTGFTACPGANLYPLLPTIRDRVAARGLPKIWNPRLNEEQVVLGDPVNLRVRARGSAVLEWSVAVLGPDGTLFADLGTQAGDRLDLVWPKGGPPPHPTEPGAYAIRVRAVDGQGGVARSALLSLEVVAAPSPSPSPSPSVSPSPTVSPSP
jgi:hypothetical protein